MFHGEFRSRRGVRGANRTSRRYSDRFTRGMVTVCTACGFIDSVNSPNTVPAGYIVRARTHILFEERNNILERKKRANNSARKSRR